MKEIDYRIKDFGSGLSSALLKYFGEDFRTTYIIFKRWKELVPPGVAEKTRPIYFHKGELTVLTTTFQWASELRFNKKTIMEKINAKLGSGPVKEIDFRQGIVYPKTVSDVPEPVSVEGLSEDEKAQIEILIQDYEGDFKEIARKMYKFYYIQKKKP